MPERCVVGGCSNVSKGDISLHSFPKDANVRRTWIHFVDRTRVDFICTAYSKICSEHFENDCFDKSYGLRLQFGLVNPNIRKGPTILPGKYPTITSKASCSAILTTALKPDSSDGSSLGEKKEKKHRWGRKMKEGGSDDDMVKRCIITGCTSDSTTCSLFRFPSSRNLKAAWLDRIKQYNHPLWEGPTLESRVCEKHFSPDCLEYEGGKYLMEFGLSNKQRLVCKPNAVPSIFPKAAISTANPAARNRLNNTIECLEENLAKKKKLLAKKEKKKVKKRKKKLRRHLEQLNTISQGPSVSFDDEDNCHVIQLSELWNDDEMSKSDQGWDGFIEDDMSDKEDSEDNLDLLTVKKREEETQRKTHKRKKNKDKKDKKKHKKRRPESTSENISEPDVQIIESEYSDTHEMNDQNINKEREGREGSAEPITVELPVLAYEVPEQGYPTGTDPTTPIPIKITAEHIEPSSYIHPLDKAVQTNFDAALKTFLLQESGVINDWNKERHLSGFHTNYEWVRHVLDTHRNMCSNCKFGSFCKPETKDNLPDSDTKGRMPYIEALKRFAENKEHQPVRSIGVDARNTGSESPPFQCSSSKSGKGHKLNLIVPENVTVIVTNLIHSDQMEPKLFSVMKSVVKETSSSKSFVNKSLVHGADFKQSGSNLNKTVPKKRENVATSREDVAMHLTSIVKDLAGRIRNTQDNGVKIKQNITDLDLRYPGPEVPEALELSLEDISNATDNVNESIDSGATRKLSEDRDPPYPLLNGKHSDPSEADNFENMQMLGSKPQILFSNPQTSVSKSLMLDSNPKSSSNSQRLVSNPLILGSNTFIAYGISPDKDINQTGDDVTKLNHQERLQFINQKIVINSTVSMKNQENNAVSKGAVTSGSSASYNDVHSSQSPPSACEQLLPQLSAHYMGEENLVDGDENEMSKRQESINTSRRKMRKPEKSQIFKTMIDT